MKTFTMCLMLLVALVTLLQVSGASSAELVITPVGDSHSRSIGTSVVFTCSALGLPETVVPKLKWTDQEGDEIVDALGSRVYIEKDGDQALKLYITQIESGDAGYYTCSSHLEGHRVSEQTELRIFQDIMFENAPAEQHAKLFSDAFITCIVSGQPQPTVLWKFQGRTIQAGDRYTYKTNGLLIRNITEGDSGQYTCRAMVAAEGRVNDRRIDFIVEKDITFENAPAEQFPEIYSDALITCSVSGQPLPTVSWRYRGRRIQTGDRYEITPAGLVIKDITEEDSGKYICRAEVASDGRLKEKEIDVHVQKSAAEISITPAGDTHVGLTGSHLRFTCSVSGLEQTVNPRLKWTDERGNDITNTDAKESLVIRRKDDHTLYLFMLNIDTENEGFYKCSGILGRHRISKKMQLRLFKGITFENAPAHQSPKINSDALIRCTVSTQPVPTVIWRYRGRKIQTGSRYEITTDGLVIKNITEDDNGTYTCLAHVANFNRMKQRKIEVEVQSSGP